MTMKTFEQIAAEQSWTLRIQVGVLLGYIYSLGREDAFLDYLEEQAAEENVEVDDLQGALL